MLETEKKKDELSEVSSLSKLMVICLHSAVNDHAEKDALE